MSFREAMREVRKSEGGYANDSQDLGGETYIGISRKNWGKWAGWPLIDRMKKNAGHKIKTNHKFSSVALNRMVDTFYIDRFWGPLRCDKIKNPVIAEHLFDCGINLGKKSAVKFFQQTVNFYPKGSHIVIDGLIGPNTLYALNAMDRQFVNYLVQERIRLYFKKCYKKPFKFKYLKGWCLRSLKYLSK